ncbi:hypothetical protein BEP19_10215 [Ammoniphilus oxalaticus]|uniref:DUF948 domain-containing protein n=1 Tax=Ammoniphilus oxalaticus TaxID=66863 RepID=A0A419SFS0_9BACL|nr:hypothetical protein BEP19_10215 [Ammoniphilus oxalaticus]
MAFQVTILEFSALLASISFMILVIYLVRILKRLKRLIADLQVNSNQIKLIVDSLATTGKHIQDLTMTIKDETEIRKDRLGNIGNILSIFHVGMDLYQKVKEKGRDVA